MSRGAPILVTGSHRSGTTWVGRILASAPGIAYIHEPFHPDHHRGICAARFERWFTYVCDANESQYERALRDTLEFRYDLGGRLAAVRGLRSRLAEAVTWGRLAARRARGMRPLLKDPIALFSAEWLASRFGTANVVLIRHPAAFAGSLKAAGWRHPFADFLEQPLLMRDHLQPFEGEIAEFAAREHDIVDQAALLWNVIHATILRYREAHPDWAFVRHEDLSRDPMGGFRSLFERLGLEFSAGAAAAIREHSFGGEGSGELKRDSLANISTWKSRLTPEEIARLRAKVGEISAHFYSDDEWSA